MFSDRLRRLKILLPLLCLLALGSWYASNADSFVIGFSRCLTDPARYDGQVLYLSLQGVVEVGEGAFVVTNVGRRVPVVGPTDGLEVGDTVSIIGNFDADRRVVVQSWREIHSLRPLKYVLGVVGLVFTAFYFSRTLRWRDGRLSLHA